MMCSASTTGTDSSVALADQFREAMADVPSPVAVVTTRAGGEPHGTTVSSFLSLSLDPPTVLVSLANTSTLLAKLDLGSQLGVSVLAADQAETAVRFAGEDKHDSQSDWGPAAGGPPRVQDSPTDIALAVTELVPVGDHTLVIGAVESVNTSPAAPLVHWQRAFGTWTTA